MATSFRIDPDGDRDRANNLIPYVKNKLMRIFQDQMRLGNGGRGLTQLSWPVTTQEGDFIHLWGYNDGTLEPMYIVDIFSPKHIGGKVVVGIREVFPYLIFIPVTYQYREDEDTGLPALKNIPHEHSYKLEISKQGEITAKKVNKRFRINYTGGLLNTLQHSGRNNIHHANIASIMTIIDDAELGMLDWKRSSLSEFIPDHHMQWGEFILITKLACYHGSSHSIKEIGGSLAPDMHSRRDLFFNTDLSTVKGKNLTIVTTLLATDSFEGIREFLNPIKEINEYKITYSDTNGDTKDGAIIGTDIPMTFEVGEGYFNHHWEYYVPISVITDQKALHRKVRSEKEGIICPDVEYTEALKIGDEIIEEGTYTSTSRVTGLMVIGNDVVQQGESGYQYSLNMGTVTQEVMFSVTGSGYSITPRGILTVGDGACGDAVISATIPHCTVLPKTVQNGCPDIADIDVTIIGADTAVKNSTQQFTSGCGCGTVEWSVSGTGVSIAQTGLVTIGATPCEDGSGKFTVHVSCTTCGGNKSASKTVRVTDYGSWVWVYAALYGFSYNCPDESPSCVGGFSESLIWNELIDGEYFYRGNNNGVAKGSITCACVPNHFILATGEQYCFSISGHPLYTCGQHPTAPDFWLISGRLQKYRWVCP